MYRVCETISDKILHLLTCLLTIDILGKDKYTVTDLSL